MKIFAVIFPGQGSQQLGMLKKLAKQEPEILDTFSEASSILNYDLWKLIQDGPIEELNKTWKTQPALLTASVSIWRVWERRNIRVPEILAGHSLGEYSALVCSESLDFESAIELVELRGKLMQNTVPFGIGAMSVIIGLNSEVVSEICRKVTNKQVVTPANFNSHNQIVISGHKEAVIKASLSCKKAGAKIISLPISVPSHCILMKPAAKELEKKLEEVSFRKPKIPIINSINVKIEKNPKIIRKKLIQQLYSPVRWRETIERIRSFGIKYLLEFGPGSVLTGLTKHIFNDLSGIAINDPNSLSKCIKKIN